MKFDWDEANTVHIARHNVTPQEVEQAFANNPLVVLATRKHTLSQVRTRVLGALRDRSLTAAAQYRGSFRSRDREGAVPAARSECSAPG